MMPFLLLSMPLVQRFILSSQQMYIKLMLLGIKVLWSRSGSRASSGPRSEDKARKPKASKPKQGQAPVSK